MDDDIARDSAFRFAGDWREFAPIAFTNLLLSVVTLGIYTFWARARVRRYLWSRTHFIDDRLEWTGTGLELFVGYLMAFVLILLPLGVAQFLIQAFVLRGHGGWAGLLAFGIYLFILYMSGIAVFRALRYRLSRTWWHGIRGGSDDPGLAYGWSHFWRAILGSLTLGLMVPWSMTTLWNERWRKMSFGPWRFDAQAKWGPVFARFLLFYLLPIAVVVLVFGLFGVMMGSGLRPGESPGVGGLLAVVFGVLLFYVLFFGVLGVIALTFYAAYFREVVGTLALGELEFSFTATTRAWIKLFLGNVGLVIVTLGIGYIFVGYRNWSFFVRHLEAHGEVRLDQLTQSATRAPGQGEGLLDAFDMGSF